MGDMRWTAFEVACYSNDLTASRYLFCDPAPITGRPAFIDKVLTIFILHSKTLYMIVLVFVDTDEAYRALTSNLDREHIVLSLLSCPLSQE